MTVQVLESQSAAGVSAVGLRRFVAQQPAEARPRRLYAGRLTPKLGGGVGRIAPPVDHV